MLRTILTVYILVAIGFIVGCSDSTSPREPLVIPDTYDSVAWRVNAADELLYLDQMTALLTELERGNTAGVKVEEGQIIALWPNVSRYIKSSSESDAWLLAFKCLNASGNTINPMTLPDPSLKGGLFVRYLFDEVGLDAVEALEKMLYSLALHRQAVLALDTATPTVRNVDRALALFGATPAFKNSDKATTNTDRFCAAYAARRDKNDGAGFYTTIRDAFKKARAAAAAGSAYKQEYDEAVRVIKQTWERSQMATAINYCFSTVTSLSATTPNDSTIVSGMHAFGEANGFLSGWQTVDQNIRIATHAQITEILALMRTPDFGPQRPYEFWQQPASTLPDLITVTQRLQTMYGFSNAELADFKQNWVTVQARK